MKMKFTALLTLPMIATSANAAVLLGGFDGNNAYNAPKQDAGVVGLVSVELTGPGNNGVPMQQLNSLWGTQAFLPAAEAVVDDTVGIFDSGTALLTITVTNTGTNDVLIDSIHWRTKRDTNESPTQTTITYTAGDLSDSIGANQTYSLGSTATQGFDKSLSDFMTDLTLAAGESATFSWFADQADPSPRRLRVDNFAISGEVVPEPGSLALRGLGGLLIARRRRG